MEHSTEQVIREKIRQAELIPVTWKNEWVWSRIELPTKQRTNIVWYAMAALALVGMMAFIFYWNSVKYRVEMLGHLNALESQLYEMESLATQNGASDEICGDAESTVMNTAMIVISKRARIKVLPTMELELADVMVTNYSVEVAEDKTEIVATLIDSPSDLINVERQEIKPIIGIFPRTSQYQEITNSTGLKVVVFKSENSHLSTSTDSKEYKILSARINR